MLKMIYKRKHCRQTKLPVEQTSMMNDKGGAKIPDEIVTHTGVQTKFQEKFNFRIKWWCILGS